MLRCHYSVYQMESAISALVIPFSEHTMGCIYNGNSHQARTDALRAALRRVRDSSEHPCMTPVVDGENWTSALHLRAQ